MKGKFQLVEIWVAGNDMEALVIKGFLESHHIPCLLKSHAVHSVHQFTLNGLGEVRILVPENLAEEAKKLIKTHQNKPWNKRISHGE